MIQTPEEIKPQIYIPYNLLPESRAWKIGKVYRVKAVIKQVGSTEDGASFELVDASSLEPADREARRYLLSDTGSYKAN